MLEELTKRESEIMALIAKGHTNREISQTLNIAPSTLKTHIVHIYDKMEVFGRSARGDSTMRVRLVLKYQQLEKELKNV